MAAGPDLPHSGRAALRTHANEGGELVFRSLVGAALTFACALPSDAAACSLRVGWEEWSPYILRTAEGFRGPEYERLAHVAEAAGCALVMEEIPWSRALRALRLGEIEMLYAAGYSEERAAFGKFSAPYRHEQVVLVARAPLAEGDVVSLKSWLRERDSTGALRDLGVIRGNFYGAAIDDIIGDFGTPDSIHPVADDASLIGMLFRNRIDGYLLEDGLFRSHQSRARSPIFRKVIKEQKPEPLHYMFGRAVDDSVVARFDAAIHATQLSETGPAPVEAPRPAEPAD